MYLQELFKILKEIKNLENHIIGKGNVQILLQNILQENKNKSH